MSKVAKINTEFSPKTPDPCWFISRFEDKRMAMCCSSVENNKTSAVNLYADKAASKKKRKEKAKQMK